VKTQFFELLFVQTHSVLKWPGQKYRILIWKKTDIRKRTPI